MRRLRNWLTAGFAAVIIALALAVGLFRVLAPQLPEHRAQIEAWASEAIGLPVSVGRLDARWRLHGPELVFIDAHILSPDRTATVVRAASGSVGISLWRLALQRELALARLSLTGAHIGLERDRDGRLRLLGLDRPPAGGWPLDALPEARLELRDAELSYQDSITARGPWRFTRLDVRVARDGDAIRAEGSLELPAALGERVSFKADVNIADNGADAAAEIFAEAAGIELPGWSRLLPARLPVPEAGHGDLVVRAALRGPLLARLSVDADLAGVAPAGVPPDAGGERFVFDRFAGRFDWDRTHDGWLGTATRLELERAGSRWPESELLLSVRRSGPGATLHAEGSFLRVEDALAPLAAAYDHPLLARVAEFEPRGVLRDFAVDYARGPDGEPRYRLRATVADAAVQAVGRLPALAGVGGTVEATDSGGRAELSSKALELTLEPMFRGTLHADVARGAATWRRSRAGWRIVSDAVELRNRDLHLRSSFEIGLADAGGAPVVDLDIDLVEGRLERLEHYLPVGILRPKVAAWMERAVAGGRVEDGRVELHGPLDAFPFDDGGGEFRARFAVVGATFDYAPGWPVVEALDAELEFTNASLQGRALDGRLLGHRIVRAEASFADIRSGVLRVEGQSKGPLEQVEAFVTASPLERRIGALTDRLEVHAGEAQVSVDLELPIRRIADRRVDGALVMRGGVLGMPGVDERFKDVNGTLELDDGALAGGELTGVLFGRQAVFEIVPGDAADPRAVAVLSGRLDDRNLSRDLRLPLAERLRGETGWRATARLPARAAGGEAGEAPFVLRVESALEGMAVDFPAPFAKGADAARPLAIDFRFPAPDRLDVGGSWGDLLRTRVHFTKPAGEWVLAAGAAHVGGGALAMPESGFTVQGSMPELRLEEWLALRAPGTGSGAPAPLKSFKLALGDLYAFGQRVAGPVALSAERSASEWLVQIESRQVAGAIFLPFDLRGEAPLLLRMERLRLVEPDPRAITGRPPPDPRRLPAMDIRADEFAHGVRRFGALEAVLARSSDGLSLTRLTTTAPSFTASATGEWIAVDGGQRTRLALEVTSEDVGATMAALGYGDAVEAESGSASFDLRWPDAPAGDVLGHLSGTASVHLEDGQLNDVEPGAGRVFGLLSLSALPRRMGLDFRDVFQKGLAFDRIEGDFAIEDGHAYTSNLLLEGPAADIGIIGRAGLAARDYDQTAIVSANVGRSLPIAGFLAGGPQVAAAMLLFSQIFKKPLKGMTQVYYHVDGSWDDPQVERVAAASAEEPAGGSP